MKDEKKLFLVRDKKKSLKSKIHGRLTSTFIEVKENLLRKFIKEFTKDHSREQFLTFEDKVVRNKTKK